MKPKRLFASIGAGALLLTSVPADARQPAAHYDLSKEVTLSGMVRAFIFTNPHSLIRLDVPGLGQAGKLWSLDAGASSGLAHAGIDAKTFQPGDQVTIVAHPSKDGRPTASLVSIAKADGPSFRLSAR